MHSRRHSFRRCCACRHRVWLSETHDDGPRAKVFFLFRVYVCRRQKMINKKIEKNTTHDDRVQRAQWLREIGIKTDASGWPGLVGLFHRTVER